MKIVEDLGSLNGVRFAIFKCNKCYTNIRQAVSDSKRSKTGMCRSCSMLGKNITHNDAKSKLYSVWNGIRKRCNSVNNHAYENYGARGISLCDEWNNSYETFRGWSIVNGYSDGLSIDRINNDGNYEPSNCRWVTQLVQAQNQRVCKLNNSGYRGVHLSYISSDGEKRWIAKIMNDGINYHLGTFSTAEDAAIAYNNKIDMLNSYHIKNKIKDNK